MDNQELKDVLLALDLLAVDLIGLAKQKKSAVEILGALLADAALRAKIEAVVENISKVPQEVKAVDAASLIDLAVFELQQLPSLIAALKA